MRLNHPSEQTRHCGFTLIELIFTVAIVAILTSLAFPSYRNYATRAKTAEGLLLADTAKKHILHINASGRGDPANGYASSYTSPLTDKVDSISIDADLGHITIDLSLAAGGGTIVLEASSYDANRIPATLANGKLINFPPDRTIIWTCLSAGSPIGKAKVGAANGTQLSHLSPAECR